MEKAILKETIKWLREKLIKTFKDSAFSRYANPKLQMVKGTKMEVHINENTSPKICMKPIPCPQSPREKAKKDLEAAVRMGIYRKVTQDVHPRLISPEIFVEKKDGGCCRVINFKVLNNKCVCDPNTILDVLNLATQVPSRLDTATGAVS